jgi:hypothetical protein
MRTMLKKLNILDLSFGFFAKVMALRASGEVLRI